MYQSQCRNGGDHVIKIEQGVSDIYFDYERSDRNKSIMKSKAFLSLTILVIMI